LPIRLMEAVENSFVTGSAPVTSPSNAEIRTARGETKSSHFQRTTLVDSSGARHNLCVNYIYASEERFFLPAILPAIGQHFVSMLQLFDSATVRSDDRPATGCSAAGRFQAKGVLRALGGLLPPGLVAAAGFVVRFRACSRPSRPSVAA
jgi:hypothetical protein